MSAWGCSAPASLLGGLRLPVMLAAEGTLQSGRPELRIQLSRALGRWGGVPNKGRSLALLTGDFLPLPRALRLSDFSLRPPSLVCCQELAIQLGCIQT